MRLYPTASVSTAAVSKSRIVGAENSGMGGDSVADGNGVAVLVWVGEAVGVGVVVGVGVGDGVGVGVGAWMLGFGWQLVKVQA